MRGKRDAAWASVGILPGYMTSSSMGEALALFLSWRYTSRGSPLRFRYLRANPQQHMVTGIRLRCYSCRRLFFNVSFHSFVTTVCCIRFSLVVCNLDPCRSQFFRCRQCPSSEVWLYVCDSESLSRCHGQLFRAFSNWDFQLHFESGVCVKP